MKTKKVNLAKAAVNMFGRTHLTSQEITELIDEVGAKTKPGWIWKNKVSRGVFDVSDPSNSAKNNNHDVISHNDYTFENVVAIKSKQISEKLIKPESMLSYIPLVNDEFVPCTNYRIFNKIIKSGKFYPTYITGESGIGKTFSILQSCANQKRECIRVNFTEETSERDLIGGMKLIVKDGVSVTAWNDGPVLMAMKRGAILVLDEVDLGTSKTMCLQSILEGNTYINKQNGEIVYPAAGFNIFATANTKGQLAGRANKFIGARPQNEAFLDRFAITLTHTCADINKMLQLKAKSEFGSIDDIPEEVYHIIEDLSNWTKQVHASYENQDTDSFITPRRICDMLLGYFIFGNVNSAIKYGLERFTEEECSAYFDVWNVIKKERAAALSVNEAKVESDLDNDNGDLSSEDFSAAIQRVIKSKTKYNPSNY